MATVIGIIGLVISSHNLLMADGQPIGTDFSDVYTAGQLALKDKAASAYDWNIHWQAQKELFGKDVPFYAWSYPPPFFLIAAPLAMVSYPWALGIWQALTLLTYLYTISTILKSLEIRPCLWLPAAIGFSAVLINLGHGQNGLWTATLFGLGLVYVPKRPYLAGILLGALCYKPQFGLLIPLVLICGRYWRTFGAAALTVILACTVSTLWFGKEIWPAFMNSISPTTNILLEQGNTGWYKIQSVFAAVRALGGSISLAYMIHGLVACGVAFILAWTWNRYRATPLTNALLITGAFLMTPYCLDYDIVMLAPALAFAIFHNRQINNEPYQISLLVWVWVMPFLARIVMKHTNMSLGCLTILLFFCHSIYCLKKSTRLETIKNLSAESKIA